MSHLSLHCVETSETRASCEATVPDDLDAFAGHFESMPVVPGVLLLDALAVRLVSRAFADLGPLRSGSRIKFHRPVRPGDILKVLVTRTTLGSAEVTFEIRSVKGLSASGRLVFAGEQP